MVKKHIISLISCMLLTTTPTMAEGKFHRFLTTQSVSDRKWFNHIDVAGTIGTSGLGFDIAFPMSEWAQLRIGGAWMPYLHFDPSFGIEVAENLPKDIQGSKFNKIADEMQSILGTRPELNVKMEGDASMSNFKCLVDIFPIKKNRNFHVTVGFYYGNTDFITAAVSPYSMRNMTAIGALNSLYKKALSDKTASVIDAEGMGITIPGGVSFENTNKRLREWGETGKTVKNRDDLYGKEVENKLHSENAFSVAIGHYSHNIVAKEDIYYDYSAELDNPYNEQIGTDNQGNPVYREVRYQLDENGRPIVKGGIRYHKGELMHKSGDPIRMAPDENNQISVSGRGWWKFKPYIGVGYSVPITKDKRTTLGIDAGITIWGGTPAIDVKVPLGQDAAGNAVYNTINLVKDAKSMPNSVDKYVKLVKLLPVMPEISIRIAQRLW